MLKKYIFKKLYYFWFFIRTNKNYSESSDNADMYKNNKIHEIQKIKKNESI